MRKLLSLCLLAFVAIAGCSTANIQTSTLAPATQTPIERKFGVGGPANTPNLGMKTISPAFNSLPDNWSALVYALNYDLSILDTALTSSIINLDISGNTDVSTQINAALTQCATSGGGIVTLPTPGAIYGVASTIAVPRNCGLVGAGKYGGTTFKALTSNMDVMSLSSTSGFGNRGPAVSDFAIDGAGIATRGMVLNLAAFRRIEGVRIQHCGGGFVLSNAQNNTFIDDEAENNQVDATNGAGLRLAWGSAGNVFLRFESDSNYAYDVLLHSNSAIDPDSSPTPTVDYPNQNIFIDNIYEHPVTNQTVDILRITNGNYNQWINGVFSGAGASAAINEVYIDTDDAGAHVDNNVFDNSYFTGDSNVTAFNLRHALRTMVLGNSQIVGAAVGFTVDDNSTVMAGPINENNVTTVYNALGSKTRQAVIQTQYPETQNFLGRLQFTADEQHSFTTQTFSTTYTPDPTLGEVTSKVLAGNTSILAPAVSVNGQHLTFHLQQPASGGPYTVSFAGAYIKPNWAVQNPTASSATTYVFEYSGSWKLIGYGGGGFHTDAAVHFAVCPASPLVGTVCSVDNSSVNTWGGTCDGAGAISVGCRWDGSVWAVYAK